MMKYDDASWHVEGDFPSDLPPECGATHIGMFLAWAVRRGQVSMRLRDDAHDGISDLRHRRISGRDFGLRECDGTLVGEDLSSEGRDFASAYYSSSYYEDYLSLFPKARTLYHVEDWWENYARVEALLDRRFAEWAGR